MKKGGATYLFEANLTSIFKRSIACGLTYHIIVVFYVANEIQRRIAPVYDLVLSVLQEAALVLRPTEALSDQLTLQGHSLSDAEAVEVLCETCLSLLVDHKDEVDIIGFKIHF